MLTYINLVIITGNVFSLRTDDILDFQQICNSSVSINSRILLNIKIDDISTIDVSLILLDYPDFKDSTDIYDFINKLTPEIIYTYRTDSFNTNKFIRCFSNSDLPGDTIISPYNIQNGEEVNYTDDPTHSDIIIRCSEYDLSRVIPIIDGKLRYCYWNNNQIMIPNSIDLVSSTDHIDFLSFNEDSNCTLVSCKDIDLDTYSLTDNIIPILILAGCMFYDDPSIYRFNRLTNRIVLNKQFIEVKFKDTYANLTDILNDRDSFIILMNTRNIFIRNIFVAQVGADDDRVLSYYEAGVSNKHSDYICLDVENHLIKGLVAIDTKYKYANSDNDPMEHHAYTRDSVKYPRLIQMVLC